MHEVRTSLLRPMIPGVCQSVGHETSLMSARIEVLIGMETFGDQRNIVRMLDASLDLFPSYMTIVDVCALYTGADPGILKRGAGKRAKPRTERRRRERRRGPGGRPQKILKKLDAISCNLAYIFGIRMASDIIQNWVFAEQKTVAAMISKPTDIR